MAKDKSFGKPNDQQIDALLTKMRQDKLLNWPIRCRKSIKSRGKIEYINRLIAFISENYLEKRTWNVAWTARIGYMTASFKNFDPLEIDEDYLSLSRSINSGHLDNDKIIALGSAIERQSELLLDTYLSHQTTNEPYQTQKTYRTLREAGGFAWKWWDSTLNSAFSPYFGQYC